MKRGVQEMRGGMVAADIVAAGCIHFSDGCLAGLRVSEDHLAHMDDDASRRFAHLIHLDLPGTARSADHTGIRDLSAGLDVEAGLRQQHLHPVPSPG